MQAETARSARHDGDFAIEGEDVAEIIESDLGLGGHVDVFFLIDFKIVSMGECMEVLFVDRSLCRHRRRFT